MVKFITNAPSGGCSLPFEKRPTLVVHSFLRCIVGLNECTWERPLWFRTPLKMAVRGRLQIQPVCIQGLCFSCGLSVLVSCMCVPGSCSFSCLLCVDYVTFTFTFSHLADAFIQSDLQLGNTYSDSSWRGNQTEEVLVTPSLSHCSNKYKLAREGEKDKGKVFLFFF